MRLGNAVPPAEPGAFVSVELGQKPNPVTRADFCSALIHPVSTTNLRSLDCAESFETMTMVEEILEAISAEFRDLREVRTAATVCFRLVLAGILGGCLGYERESKGKSAGLRTHMLVSLGAAVFVMGPHLAGFEDAGLSRVIQGLIAGIGFLGAGAIVKGRPGEDVEGLTTAASIWMTAAIGVTTGMGRASTAILSTALALLVLAVLLHGERLLRPRNPMPQQKSDERASGDTERAS